MADVREWINSLYGTTSDCTKRQFNIAPGGDQKRFEAIGFEITIPLRLQGNGQGKSDRLFLAIGCRQDASFSSRKTSDRAYIGVRLSRSAKGKNNSDGQTLERHYRNLLSSVDPAYTSWLGAYDEPGSNFWPFWKRIETTGVTSFDAYKKAIEDGFCKLWTDHQTAINL